MPSNYFVNEISSPSTYTYTDDCTVSYYILYSFFSDNHIQPDDGQKQYWPKHVVTVKGKGKVITITGLCGPEGG